MVARQYGAKFPKAVMKITDDEDGLPAFYGFPAEHRDHLRTTNLIESALAAVRLRTKVTQGAGSRAAAGRRPMWHLRALLRPGLSSPTRPSVPAT